MWWPDICDVRDGIENCNVRDSYYIPDSNDTIGRDICDVYDGPCYLVWLS